MNGKIVGWVFLVDKDSFYVPVAHLFSFLCCVDSGVRVAQALVFCVRFVDHCLFIFIFAIVLSALRRCTSSDYPLTSR
jgi:hypothetical protein